MRRSTMSMGNLGLLVALLLAPLPAHAQSSEEQAQTLQQLLRRFPAADANRDGVLTREEARAYRTQQQRTQRAGANANRQAQDQPPAVEPTHANVAYGQHERNVLDFYRVPSESPTPLLIYIHGGGFVGGDKRSFNQAILKAALDAGISCAALNYRFVNGKDMTFPVPQHDCARALQFLRSKADEYNLDPERVASFGGSAGAGISMWLGFHDDLANAEDPDPVLRQSTRLRAVGSLGGQPTYDPIKIKELIGGRAWEHPSLRLVYGISTLQEALAPDEQLRMLYDEASAITHLTADDPPVFMIYSEPDRPLPDDAKPGQGIHHPNFGKLLKREMDRLGIENVYVHTDDAGGANPSLQMFQFFQKHLEITATDR